MTTQAQAAPAARSSSMPLIVLVAGWLIPGAGHFLLRKPVRGVLLFVSIVGMLTTGLLLGGKLYQTGTGDLLDLLGFICQLGGGLPYLLARTIGWGQLAVLTAVGDWGTKFILVAGLLNVISAVDAHSLANGRKAS